LSEDALRLVEEREASRKRGDWKASDEIRKKLLGMGIEISDTAHGVTWRLK
jgi:cysteinyl-tRNA synthetase